MKNKKLKSVVLLGSIASLALYIKYLLSLKLTVSEKVAFSNGSRLLNFTGKILVVTAHPDDLEIFTGGTLKLLRDHGRVIHIIDVTDGEKGVQRKDLAETRISEQINAGKVLDIDNIYFLHLPDLHLEYVKNLEDVLDACVSIINPDLIFAFDYKFPWRPIVHPDHIATGEAISNIIKKEVNKNITLLFYATRKPNIVIDISDSIESKISAVMEHRSQLRFGTKPYGYLTRKFAKYNASKTFGEYVEVFRLEDNHIIK